MTEDKHVSVDMEEKTESSTEAMAKENEILAKNIALKKEMAALEAVSGKSEAGEQPEADKKMTDKEYLAELRKGKVPEDKK